MKKKLERLRFETSATEGAIPPQAEDALKVSNEMKH